MAPQSAFSVFLEPHIVAPCVGYILFLIVTVPRFDSFCRWLGYGPQIDALNPQKICDIRSRWASFVHSVVTSAGASYVLYTEYPAVMHANHPSILWQSFLAFSFGHAFYDTYFILSNWEVMHPPKKRVDGYIFLVHHVILLYCHGMIVVSNSGILGSCLSFLFECTNPFLNTRFILLYLGYSNTVLYFIVIVMFDLVWIVFRVALTPYLFYIVTFGKYAEELKDIWYALYVVGWTTAAIMIVMNSWWTYHIAIVTWKTFMGSYGGAKTDEKPKQKQK